MLESLEGLMSKVSVRMHAYMHLPLPSLVFIEIMFHPEGCCIICTINVYCIGFVACIIECSLAVERWVIL